MCNLCVTLIITDLQVTGYLSDKICHAVGLLLCIINMFSSIPILPYIIRFFSFFCIPSVVYKTEPLTDKKTLLFHSAPEMDLNCEPVQIWLIFIQ